MSERPYVVVNPAAANGRVGRGWDDLRGEIQAGMGSFDFGMTQSPTHATELARQALKDGYRRIASLGGDGTHSLVVNGFFENGRVITDSAAFGVLPVGTGGDFRRMLKVDDKDLRAYARRIRDGEPQLIDVGHISHVDHEGRPAERYFLNIASFGSSGEVDRILNNSSKALGGKLSFMLASLRAFAVYHAPHTTISVDGKPMFAGKVLVGAACNGQFFGGGMRVAPDADPTDGLLDVVVIEWMGKVRTVAKMGGVYSGKHVHLPEVHVVRGAVVRAESQERCLLDVDGEAPGGLPAEIRVVPGALLLQGYR